MSDTPRKKTARKTGKRASKKKAQAARSAKASKVSAKAKGGGGSEPRADRWLDRHLWQVQPVRDVLVVVGIFGLFWLGQKVSIVTVPLLLAMLFAYLLEPVVRLLMTRTRLERRGSVMTILGAMVLFIVLPAMLAATFGVIQSVGLAGRLANSVTVVYESIEPSRAAGEARGEFESMTTKALLNEQAEARAAEEAEQETDEPDAEADSGDSDDVSPVDEAGSQDAEAVPTVDEAGEQIDDPAPVNEAGEPLEIVPQTKYDLAKADYEEKNEKAQPLRAKVQEEAGNGWLWIHDRLASTDEGGASNAVFGVVRKWITANRARLESNAAATGASVLQTSLAFAARAFALFFMIFLTAFFFFFMATGWPRVQLFVAKLIPDKNRGLISDLGGKFDKVISAFIRGRMTIAFIQSIVFTVGYFIIGVPAAFILGPIVAVLSIVPYLASVGIPISIALLWFENHTGIRGHLLYVVFAPSLFYLAGQALDDYFLTPRIQGKSTGMSTPAILFASIAGGVLFGFFGLLIAIPLAACIKILLDEVFWPHFKDWTEGKTTDLLPFGRG